MTMEMVVKWLRSWANEVWDDINCERVHAQRTVCTMQLSKTTSSLVSCLLVKCFVARVVPLVVDAVIGLALGLIAHVVIVVFVVATLHRIFLFGKYTLHKIVLRSSTTLRLAIVSKVELRKFFNSSISLKLFHRELHVIPNFVAITVYEEIVDLVVEFIQLERSEVLAESQQFHLNFVRLFCNS